MVANFYGLGRPTADVTNLVIRPRVELNYLTQAPLTPCWTVSTAFVPRKSEERTWLDGQGRR